MSILSSPIEAGSLALPEAHPMPAPMNMQPDFEFNNEGEVKCRFTGFKGVVMGRTEWNNGCKRYSLQAKIDKDGRLPELQVFDEHDLIIVKAAAKSKATEAPPGGPRNDPSRSFGRI